MSPSSALSIRLSLADAHRQAGNLELAQELASTALVDAASLGRPGPHVDSHLALALVALERKGWVAAEAAVADARRVAETAERQALLLRVAEVDARVKLGQGNLQEADRLVSELKQENAHRLDTWLLAAEVEHQLGNAGEATAAMESARGLARERWRSKFDADLQRYRAAAEVLPAQ